MSIPHSSNHFNLAEHDASLLGASTQERPEESIVASTPKIDSALLGEGVIILPPSQYSLDDATQSYVLALSRGKDLPLCPHCQGKTRRYDKRPRKVREASGSSGSVVVVRLQCKECHRTMTVLPEGILPRRRYITEALEKVIHPAAPKTPDMGDVSCETRTMERWLDWFTRVREMVESSGTIVNELPKPSDPLPEDPWLGRIVRRLKEQLYHSTDRNPPAIP